ncbi:NADPH:quinone oxidoreductase family protein [Antarcticimicrobium sediminis]|uniref:NADPH:quinone oxidoreductase family protein n=2 Tax=Antarcticimicrobium sediminis TaxID=2546227 RepID=A0A4R5EMD4_9RHOB|nr:NADPH:quinone oxidoreductase family protein [Antarcticimicrobium sediminis]
MRALICEEYGSPPKLTRGQIPDPAPGPGEAKLAVEAVGLGYFDSVLLRGMYQEKPPLPMIPGRECCGTVVALGAGTDPTLLGRRVAAIAFTGCMAEYAIVRISDTVPLPRRMPATIGAAFLSAYATMLYALTNCGHQRAGETLLVLGASGTLGMAAIDLGRALGGRVIAAASTPAKREAARMRGAEATVDYTAHDWRDRLRDLAPSGVDIVVDPVGGSYSEPAFRHLAPNGRHLVLGFTAGEIPRLPLNLPLLKRANLVGVDWGGFAQQEPNVNAALLARLGEMLTIGSLTPSPSRTYTVATFGQAIEDLVARRSIGKPVVVLEDL